MICISSNPWLSQGFYSVNGLAGKEIYLVHLHGKAKIISQYIIISKLILMERIA